MTQSRLEQIQAEASFLHSTLSAREAEHRTQVQELNLRQKADIDAAVSQIKLGLEKAQREEVDHLKRQVNEARAKNKLLEESFTVQVGGLMISHRSEITK